MFFAMPPTTLIYLKHYLHNSYDIDHAGRRPKPPLFQAFIDRNRRSIDPGCTRRLRRCAKIVISDRPTAAGEPQGLTANGDRASPTRGGADTIGSVEHAPGPRPAGGQ